MPSPLVSIGMPVYQGERTVAAAIDSILLQSWSAWELVISDNCSTDATEAICRDYASRDPRIRYVRQAANVGAPRNFRRVLDESHGEFFMWAAADDRRSRDLIEVNVEFLRKHPEYVASCSPVLLDAAGADPAYMGDTPVLGSRARRVLNVIPAHANGRFYSVFRREALADCDVIQQDFLGSDWAVMVHVASLGCLHRTNRGWTLLGGGGASRSGNLYLGSRRRWMDSCLPFGAFAGFAWSRRAGFTTAEKIELAYRLVRLNVFGFVAQTREAWNRRVAP